MGSIIVACWDGLGIYDASSGELRARYSIGPCSQMSISPSGRLIVVSDLSNSIRIYDMEEQKLLKEMHGHFGRFGRSGLLAVADGKHVTVFDPDSYAKVQVVQCGGRLKTDVSADGSLILAHSGRRGSMAGEEDHVVTI